LEEIDAQKIEMIKNRQQYLKNCYDFLGQDRTIKVMDLDKKGGRSKKKEEERHENEHHRRKKKRSREKSDK
jgi:predicted RNA-binding protein with RPS1 domain